MIVLDKPAGITSAAALNRLKRLLPRKTKLGHAGTLDPFATGVLLVLVGVKAKPSSCRRAGCRFMRSCSSVLNGQTRRW